MNRRALFMLRGARVGLFCGVEPGADPAACSAFADAFLDAERAFLWLGAPPDFVRVPLGGRASPAAARPS